MVDDVPEYRGSVAVWLYCPPFLFALGTFGNVATVVILRRMNVRRTTMPSFLTALAVTDTCLLYTGLLRYWLNSVFQVDVRTLHWTVCKLHTWLVYSFIIMSAWLLTFMTVERTLSVWKPHRVSLLFTRTKAHVIIASVVVVSLLLNSHFLYGLDLVAGGNGTTSGSCLSKDEEYEYFFSVVWSWVDMTVASLIPFAVLIVGNSLILWKVSLSQRTARTLGSVRPGEVTQRKRRTSSMTVTLVALSIIFLLTTAPICVYNIVEIYINDGGLLTKARLQLGWAIVNILMYINSSVNFYLYCLSGAKFRLELTTCICCCCLGYVPTGAKTAEQPTTSNHSNHFYCHDVNHHHHHPHPDCQPVGQLHFSPRGTASVLATDLGSGPSNVALKKFTVRASSAAVNSSTEF